eukprot:31375-Pelagococcus_subviridis.AAC.1
MSTCDGSARLRVRVACRRFEASSARADETLKALTASKNLQFCCILYAYSDCVAYAKRADDVAARRRTAGGPAGRPIVARAARDVRLSSLSWHHIQAAQDTHARLRHASHDVRDHVRVSHGGAPPRVRARARANPRGRVRRARRRSRVAARASCRRRRDLVEISRRLDAATPAARLLRARARVRGRDDDGNDGVPRGRSSARAFRAAPRHLREDLRLRRPPQRRSQAVQRARKVPPNVLLQGHHLLHRVAIARGGRLQRRLRQRAPHAGRLHHLPVDAEHVRPQDGRDPSVVSGQPGAPQADADRDVPPDGGVPRAREAGRHIRRREERKPRAGLPRGDDDGRVEHEPGEQQRVRG